MRKLERDRKGELAKWFASDLSMRKIAILMNVADNAIHNAWVRMYGKEVVGERGKRLRSLNGRKTFSRSRIVVDDQARARILECFHGDRALADVAKKAQLDERIVRRIWRQEFGENAFRERGRRLMSLVASNSRIPEGTRNAILERLEGNPNIQVVAKEFGVSRSYVNSLASTNGEIHKSTLENASARYSDSMRRLRSKDALTNEERDKVVELAGKDLSLDEIGGIVGICGSSVHNVLRARLPATELSERADRMRRRARIRSMESLVKTGRIGSKPENGFHVLLRLALATEVKHHDLGLLPPFEIDITLPKLKVAIMWDGIGHIEPIFGEKIFEQVKRRDKWKREKLAEMGWVVFEVVDRNTRLRATFLEQQAIRLFGLLEDMGHADAIRHF
jgi:predicted DNA-binding protein YlxM (UPF0122 family)